jgi:hypothetical protein
MIFRLSLLLISLAASPPGLHVQAGDVRIGSEVVFKGRDGVKIGDHPACGHWAYVRYTVKDISSGRVRIASGSAEGWVDAHEIVPLDGAVDYFTRLIGDNPRAAWIYDGGPKARAC